jgi:hypothetical protein
MPFANLGVSPLAGAATKPFIEGKVDDSIGRRALLAGIGGISTAAVGLALHRMIPTIRKSLTYPRIGAASLATGVAGYFAPSIINQYVAKRDEGNKKGADSFLRQRDAKSLSYALSVQQSADQHLSNLNKTAAALPIGSAFGSVMKGMATGVSNAARWSGRQYWRGLRGTGNKDNFLKSTRSFAVRAGTLGAVGYGGYKAHQAIAAPRSGQNYTTYLRNQMLTGNVQPGQVDTQDLTKVRDLGMR